MAGIADASADKPYLLKLEPGTYDLGTTTLQAKSYVDIEGSGRDVTQITSTTATAGTVSAGANITLRELSIINTLTTGATALVISDSSLVRVLVESRPTEMTTNTGQVSSLETDGFPVLQDAFIRVTGGTNATGNVEAVRCNSGGLAIYNSSLNAKGGRSARALTIAGGCNATLRLSRLDAGNSQSTYGIVVESGGVSVNHSQVFGLDAPSTTRAIRLDAGGAAIRGSHIAAVGGATSIIGVEVLGAATLTAMDAQLTGATAGVSSSSSGAVKIGTSMVSSVVNGGSGTLTCTLTYNAAFQSAGINLCP